MPFFHSSSGFTINDGHFSEIGGDWIQIHNVNVTTQAPTTDIVTQLKLSGKRKYSDGQNSELDADQLRKRRRCSNGKADGLKIIEADEIDLHRELISSNGFRMHSASHGGRIVVVKVFEGPHTKQDWAITIAFSKKFLHSNVLKVAGISEVNSEPPFVVFRGTCGKRMQSMIAQALRTDLNTSVQLSMKAVKGLAAGLSYMRSQKIPIQASCNKWKNFDVFVGDNDEPVIAYHPSSIIAEGGGPSQAFDFDREGDGIEALSGICQNLFSGANSILYDDSPEREFENYNLNGLLSTNQQGPESSSGTSENEAISNSSNSTDKPKLKQNTRREVWWRLDMGSGKPNLDSIARRFEDYMDCLLSTSSNSPLRRIKASKGSCSILTSHQCPGYLREEITLTTDVARSAIVSHEFPSKSELCAVCGQLVRCQTINSIPTDNVPSAWQLYFTDWVQKQQVSRRHKINIGLAAIEYRSLNAAEKEPYERRSQAMYEAYMRTLTHEDIKRKNLLYDTRRKAGESRKNNDRDLFMFLHRISDLAAAKWRSMTDDENQPFLTQAAYEKMEYEVARRLYEGSTDVFESNAVVGTSPHASTVESENESVGFAAGDEWEHPARS